MVDLDRYQLASSRKSGLASADALGLCKSMTSSENSAVGSADPSKMASKGSADPSKTASNFLRVPPIPPKRPLRVQQVPSP